MPEKENIIVTTGRNNCGGRCLIKCHMKGNEIVRITTQTREEAGDAIPLTACAKGLQYHTTYLNDRRLKYPMKRVGKRGEGRFERISWEEAIEMLTREWIRIRDSYGPGSRHVIYGCGESSVVSGRELTKRLLALDGGFLNYYNSYSTACIRAASTLTYGPASSGNSPSDWLNASLIVLWGHNPAETVFDSITMHYLNAAHEKGIPIIGIDPRKNRTIQQLDADWYPIRPCTDAALGDALAYELYTTGRYDADFIRRFCVGFEKETMPEGIPETECYFSYLTGETDQIPKNAEWAEKITGLPAERIRELADRLWTARPCCILQGWGPQRNEYGEQAARAPMMLACLTGNVGISGGSSAGNGDFSHHKTPSLPFTTNPYHGAIPCFLWTDAVIRGREMTALDGVFGRETLTSDIKMLFSIAGNTLINQHSDINRTRQILQDPSKVEFIVVSDVFMTASAKFADLLLPAVSFLEEENLVIPWSHSEFIGYNPQVVPPLYECRSEYDWLKEVAKKLGLYEAFTAGHETLSDWLTFLYEDLRKKEPDLPAYEDLKKMSIFNYPQGEPFIAFREQIEDPAHHRFATPSGKIEIFSKSVYEKTFTDPFPAIPRYMVPDHGPEYAKSSAYPLQLVGWHTRRRSHSVHDNNPKLEKLDPRRIIMHPSDGADRGLREGEKVRIFNSYGKMILPVSFTTDIMPGVAAIAQGAWYDPDENGIDRGGCINVFTTQKPTPYAKGNPQHTNCVQVMRLSPGEA